MTKTDEGQRKRGRPKGTPNTAALVRRIAAERVVIRDANGSREVSIFEAVVMRLQLKAAKGDIMADRRLDQARARLAPADEEPAALLLVPGSLSVEEWKRRADIANRFAQKPEMMPGTLPVAPLAGAVDQPVEKPRGHGGPPKLPPGPKMQNRLIR